MKQEFKISSQYVWNLASLTLKTISALTHNAIYQCNGSPSNSMLIFAQKNLHIKTA